MADNNNMNMPTLCANCGKGEESVGDLKACTACKMVKYCHRDCQIAHRPQHKKECRKRAAELHDEKLFKQPPPNEDCPICMLILPSLDTGSKYRVCCGKRICNGCLIAVAKRDGNVGLCPFCRTPTPTPEEAVEQTKKRVELGDVDAIYGLGCYYYHGRCELPQDRAKALELWHQAAELGHAKSYYSIGGAYLNGEVVERDEKKADYYYELAAMRGHVTSRHNLGCSECEAGNYERALKHFILAAGGGLSAIQKMFKKGLVTKEDYTQALRGYQAYLGEIKSAQRDEAAAFSDRYKYYEV